MNLRITDMGHVCASFVSAVLTGNKPNYVALPLDTHDFSHCVDTIEDYLSTCDLKSEPSREKWLEPLEKVSPSWAGIIGRYEELRTAIQQKVEPQYINVALKAAKNEGILDEMQLRMRKSDYQTLFLEAKQKIKSAIEKMEISVVEGDKAEAKAKAIQEAEEKRERESDEKEGYVINPESQAKAKALEQSGARFFQKSMKTDLCSRDVDLVNACILEAARNGFDVTTEHKENVRIENGKIYYDLVIRVRVDRVTHTPELIDRLEFPKNGIKLHISPYHETVQAFRDTRELTVKEHDQMIFQLRMR